MKKTLAILLLLSLVVGCGKSEQAKEQPISSPEKAPVTQSKPPPHQTAAKFSNSHISEELSHLSEELSSLFHDLDLGTKAIDLSGVKPINEAAVKPINEAAFKPIKATKLEDVKIIVRKTEFVWEEVFSSPARAVAAAEQAATWEAIAALAKYDREDVTVKEDDFSSLTENNISGLLTYQVKIADDEVYPTVTVRMVMIPSARNTLPPIHVKQIESQTTSEEEKQDFRQQIWINNVLVIDEEITTYPNGEAAIHYRQWYSHGWKWIDLTVDNKGTVKGRSWRESGIVEQEKQ